MEIEQDDQQWYEQASQTREQSKKQKKKVKKQKQKLKKKQAASNQMEEEAEGEEIEIEDQQQEQEKENLGGQQDQEEILEEKTPEFKTPEFYQQAQNEEGIEEEVDHLQIKSNSPNDQQLPDKNQTAEDLEEDLEEDLDLEQEPASSSKKSKKKSKKRKKKQLLPESAHSEEEKDEEELEEGEKNLSSEHKFSEGFGMLSVKRILNRISKIKQVGKCEFLVPRGYVKGMNVDARFFASALLLDQVVTEVEAPGGSFSPAMLQLAQVATLPGIIGSSLGMPDIHSGYGFAIGNIAAMDMEDPNAVVSPGGVGFDINCGVRLLRTNLMEKDVVDVRSRLADAVYHAVPVGVGSSSLCQLTKAELNEVLKDGMKWAERKGHCWPEDRHFVEEGGCFETANPESVSIRAKTRGQSQVGSLGSGNHYVEVQVVDEVYDKEGAECMGINKVGQVCVMIHSGSRGLGHQVCTDALQACDAVMKRKNIKVADRQLACAPINSKEGQQYLGAMASAANFAFCNRTLLAEEVRSAFKEVFRKDARDLDMHVVYDVAHNIAKIEQHIVDNEQKQVLVHRKGATRAFAPGHKEIPEKYQKIGQPVLIGGSMGTCSYVLTGTQKAMESTFGSTCHGAGRAMSRSKAMRVLDSKSVLSNLACDGIAVRIQTKRLAAEEAPQSYKDVCQVVETCHVTGISNKCVKLRPIVSIKG